MAGDWVARRIGTLGRVVTGKTPPTVDDDNFGGPYPFVTIPDLSEGHVFICRTARTLSEQGSHVVKSSLLPPGSVMMSCIATVGKCGITASPSFTNQQINSVIPHEDIEPQFLYYVFCQLRQALESAGGGGSVYTNVSKARFSDIEICLPLDIREQRAIAHILGTLDDKIELNRRMSETLEAMARAVFKSWFVDFDPVRAKAESRTPGLPLPTGRMADEIDRLFPAALVRRPDLGEIPEGWEAGSLGDIAEMVRDQENPQSSPDVTFRHFSIPAFDDGQWPKEDAGESIKSQKSRVPPGAVLLSKLNPEIERVWLVDVEQGDRAVCSTEFLVLLPRPPFGRSFLYCLSRSATVRREIEGLVTGTSKSHQRARAAPVLALKTVLPPAPLTRAFENFARPLLRRTLAARREVSTLTSLRDTLLPKLISGELRVEDAERFVARAV